MIDPFTPVEQRDARWRAQALAARFPRVGAPIGDWRSVRQAIEQAIAGGDQPFLFELYDAAVDHPLLGVWVARATLRASALVDTPDALRAFLHRFAALIHTPRMKRRTPDMPDGPSRIIGSLLAATRSDDLLERELEFFGLDPRLEAVFACWLQERIIRGSDIGRSPFARRFWRALQGRHPLASLPLRTVEMEEHIVHTPQNSADIMGRWFGFKSAPLPGVEAVGGSWLCDFEVKPIDPDALAAVMAEPGLAPNATWEGAVVQLERRPPSLQAVYLPGLDLECLEGAPARVMAASAHEVMVALLTRATLGGSECQAHSAAYGRLLAWKSMGALVGVNGTVDEIAAAAAQCEWVRFDSDNPWFDHERGDLGVACLRPDRVLAVVATTEVAQVQKIGIRRELFSESADDGYG